MKVLVVHTFNRLQKGNDSIVTNEAALLRSCGAEVEVLRLTVHQGSKASVILNTIFNYSSLRQIRKRISTFSPDIVHLHYLDYGSLAAAVYAVKKYKLPLVYTPHSYSLLCPSQTLFHKDRLYKDSIRQIFPYKSIREALYQKSKMLSLSLSFSMFFHQLFGTWNKMDKMIVYGEAMRELFLDSKLSSLSDKITFNAPFSFPAGKDRSGPVQAPYYLYSGEFTDESGIPVLLEAFADNGLPLKVAGRGFLSKLVCGYSEFYPNISLIETADPVEMTRLFENASALIIPSVWYEPFGSVVTKAFSMGLPVIASNLGVLPEMITHGYNGLLFDPGNDKDLRKKVDQFQSLRWSESKKYRENALRTYQYRFTPENAAARLTGIYESLYIPKSGDKYDRFWGYRIPDVLSIFVLLIK
jgi:glycosyltransferase involved in cell wall biosynthesis